MSGVSEKATGKLEFPDGKKDKSYVEGGNKESSYTSTRKLREKHTSFKGRLVLVYLSLRFQKAIDQWRREAKHKESRLVVLQTPGSKAADQLDTLWLPCLNLRPNIAHRSLNVLALRSGAAELESTGSDEWLLAYFLEKGFL
ncbi:hypothetical protein WN944_019009 [Citrus x changshan-huyou]|uniref:Uncharacterized protein n=1 Tax=Citrus x changshan-huyou TaxID=2935761 RepID=A0AAP0QJ21_9ROSI